GPIGADDVLSNCVSLKDNLAIEFAASGDEANRNIELVEGGGQDFVVPDNPDLAAVDLFYAFDENVAGKKLRKVLADVLHETARESVDQSHHKNSERNCASEHEAAAALAAKIAQGNEE